MRRRNPWTWPLIALIAVLVLVLVGVIIALVVAPNHTPKPTHSATTNSTPANTPSPTPSLISLDPSKMSGMNKAAAQAYITGLGLAFQQATSGPATTASQVGTVDTNNVSPVGNLSPGTVVTVPFFGAVASPSAPTAATSDTPMAMYPLNMPINISWTAYVSCPSGLPLSGYVFTATNGATLNSSSPGADETTDQVTPTQAGNIAVTYVAVCGTGSSAVNSDPSPALNLTAGP